MDPRPWQGSLYQPTKLIEPGDVRLVQLVAIPYYAWANRGIGGMRVWIPQSGG